MTCAFGASVKPGLDPNTQVLVDRSLWETVTGTASSWFDWLLDIFVPNTIKASDLCALNLADPTLPSLSVLVASLAKDPFSITVVSDYIRDKLRYAAFQTACICNAAPPSTTCHNGWSSVPTWATQGAPGVTLELGNDFTVDVADAVCTGGVVYLPAVASPAATLDLWDRVTNALLATVGVSGSSGAVVFTFGTPVALTNGRSYSIALQQTATSSWFYNASALSWSNAYFHSTGIHDSTPSGTFPNLPQSGTYPIEPTVCVTATPGTTTPTAPVQPSQPPLLQLPPAWACSTIGDLCTRLQQVDEKIDWLMRQSPIPTSRSVAESTAHAGLTGTGSLAVSGIVGLRLLLTTVPTVYGSHPGTPTYHFGLGRVDWSTGEGWEGGFWIAETPTVIDAIGPAVTTIGYSLAPGVVATIVELARGP